MWAGGNDVNNKPQEERWRRRMERRRADRDGGYTCALSFEDGERDGESEGVTLLYWLVLTSRSH